MGQMTFLTNDFSIYGEKSVSLQVEINVDSNYLVNSTTSPNMSYRFTAQIVQNEEMDAAYVVVPFDIRAQYGVGRLKVEALFDGEPYNGSVVNMGVRDAEGNICYIIGLTKAVRKKIGKTFGDRVEVELTPILK